MGNSNEQGYLCVYEFQVRELGYHRASNESIEPIDLSLTCIRNISETRLCHGVASVSDADDLSVPQIHERYSSRLRTLLL